MNSVKLDIVSWNDDQEYNVTRDVILSCFISSCIMRVGILRRLRVVGLTYMLITMPIIGYG